MTKLEALLVFMLTGVPGLTINDEFLSSRFFINRDNLLLVICKVQKFRNFFTDDRLLMVTIDVMPLDAIGIKVVQNGNASLVFASLALFPVVWLSPSKSVEVIKKS